VFAGAKPWSEVELDSAAVATAGSTGASGKGSFSRDLHGHSSRAVTMAGSRPAEPVRPIAALILEEQSGLSKAAVLDDGLADFIALAVEVFDAAAERMRFV